MDVHVDVIFVQGKSETYGTRETSEKRFDENRQWKNRIIKIRYLLEGPTRNYLDYNRRGGKVDVLPALVKGVQKIWIMAGNQWNPTMMGRNSIRIPVLQFTLDPFIYHQKSSPISRKPRLIHDCRTIVLLGKNYTAMLGKEFIRNQVTIEGGQRKTN
ncbi:unnamed protein product, partial [Nesidiocoris tenuis]